MIDKYERLALESMMTKEEKMKSLEARAAELEAELDVSNKECDEVMDSFKVAQNHVEEMVTSFKTSRFTLAVASGMSYDQNTQFNEQNIIQYLAEIEEYISSLITF